MFRTLAEPFRRQNRLYLTTDDKSSHKPEHARILRAGSLDILDRIHEKNYPQK